MKNLKIGMKLVVSFSFVIVLAVFVGLVGILGMNTINNADDDLYNYNVIALEALGSMRENFVMQQRDLRTCIIRDSGHPNYIAARQRIATLQDEMQEHMALYTPTMNTKEDESLFTRFTNAYNAYELAMDDMLRMTDQNKVDEALDILDNVGAGHAAEISSVLAEAESFNANAARDAVNDNTGLFQKMTLIEAAILAVTVIFSMILIYYISGLISKPLGVMAMALNQIGTTGDLQLTPDMAKSAAECATWKEEIGTCARAVGGLIGHLTNVEKNLSLVANGDLSITVTTLSERDTIGLSVSKLVDNLNNMFGDINASTAQVSTGSRQIADGAQTLAQGSTEQASAVQQLSASVSEIAEKTKTNAQMAGKAANLAHAIMGNAEKGTKQMDEMMSAVKEINQASQSINKVIKVIDDLAFQTNILALNAAVEAARAGQHGKGFAVVAEEVRNLAAKSAEAAKNTEELIANSMEKAELGARIADETATSLAEIVSGINESNQLVSEIAKSSEEQSGGIAQVNTGIDQVAQVVQQNSATAEESAAASQEMSGQADMLESLIAQFKLKDDGTNNFRSLPPTGRNSYERLPAPDNNGMGKY